MEAPIKADGATPTLIYDPKRDVRRSMTAEYVLTAVLVLGSLGLIGFAFYLR